MKKILSLLLVLAFLLGLAGCHASNDPKQTLTSTIQTETTVDQTETTTDQTESTSDQTETTADTQSTTQSTESVVSQKPENNPSPEAKPQPITPVETQPEKQPESQPSTEPTQTETTSETTAPAPQKSYTRKDEVAQYIHEHGRLPDNFITKDQARALGWRSGSLEPYAPGKCIGGDRFYNRENLLPQGHTYYECDIDTLGKASRGAKRIVFSDDGLIYYTSDHYRSFTLLYGEP